MNACTSLATVILIATVTTVALAQDAPTRRQRIAAIDKQLASGDVNEIHRGLAAIDAAIALDRFMAIEGSGFRVQGSGGSKGTTWGNDEARNPKPESMAKDEARMTKTATERRSHEATKGQSKIENRKCHGRRPSRTWPGS
jgi:hypothetical protein